MSAMDDVLKRNNMTKRVDLKAAADLATLAIQQFTSAQTSLLAAQEALDGNTDEVVQQAAEGLDSLTNGLLVGLTMIANMGLDAPLVLRLALQAEASGRPAKTEEMVRAAFGVFLGPAYHSQLGLTLPRE